MEKPKSVSFILLGLIISLLIVRDANCREYPVKPIKLVVTSSAGGGEDLEARGIAPFLEKYLGTRVIIENQPGAGGKIAFEKFQKTPPDGYTLITSSFPKSVIMEYMGQTGYRTRELTPIFAWSRFDAFITVHRDSWRTFEEFIKAAKTKRLAAGIPGIGGTNHLTGLMMIDKLGIKVTWIPYESGANSYAALAGKHIDVAFGSAAGLVPLVEAGKLRMLVCLSKKRNPYFPDVPTPRELGYDIVPITTIRGAEAPPKTSVRTVKVLEEAFRKVVNDPKYLDWAKRNKVVIAPLDSREFGKAIEEAYTVIEKYQPMLKE